MQRQTQSASEIPASIQQLAETRRMGELLAVYPRQYQGYHLTTVIFLIFVIGITGSVIPMVLDIVFGISWLYYVLFLVLLGIAICLLVVRNRNIHRSDRVFLYDSGFIFLNGRTTTGFRWDNITQILRGTPQSEGEGIGDIDTITVKTELETFRLDTTWEKHLRADMCDRIERGFVTTRLPQTIAQYNAGAEIAFETSANDFLCISQFGFRDPKELLAWPQVEKAEVGSELIIIRKEGRTSDWYHKPICKVPNAALLKALLDYLQGDSVR